MLPKTAREAGSFLDDSFLDARFFFDSSDSNALTLAAAIPRAETTTIRAQRGEIDEIRPLNESISEKLGLEVARTGY
jgi:hypothetical protein